MRRRVVLAITLLFIGYMAVQAQIVVSDPAITIRNTVTAVVKELLARSKRLRDTEAGNVNMQLLMWRDGPAVNDAFVRGAADALRSWRQP